MAAIDPLPLGYSMYVRENYDNSGRSLKAIPHENDYATVS